MLQFVVFIGMTVLLVTLISLLLLAVYAFVVIIAGAGLLFVAGVSKLLGRD